MFTPTKVRRLKESGRVFLVAAETIQRFGYDDIEASIEGVTHESLESGTHERGS